MRQKTSWKTTETSFYVSLTYHACADDLQASDLRHIPSSIVFNKYLQRGEVLELDEAQPMVQVPTGERAGKMLLSPHERACSSLFLKIRWNRTEKRANGTTLVSPHEHAHSSLFEKIRWNRHWIRHCIDATIDIHFKIFRIMPLSICLSRSLPLYI